MTQTEKEILETLLHLEDTIARMATTNPKPSLLPIFTKLDTLTAQLPRGTSPDLLHYMHKKSYQKARLWLQGLDAENAVGNCHTHQP